MIVKVQRNTEVKNEFKAFVLRYKDPLTTEMDNTKAGKDLGV